MLKLIAGMVLGASLGILFWRFTGCSTGTCPITSSPIIYAGFGFLIGLVVVVVWENVLKK